MKINETILTLLTDTDTLLESVYQAIDNVDPNYAEEMAIYEQAVQALLQTVPDAAGYLTARRQELASDIRFALWQGFLWGLECFRSPFARLLKKLDFEDLCQEPQMHALPAAQAARATARACVYSLPADAHALLEPIIDHFAYLETYGYKLAHAAGADMAGSLLRLFAGAAEH